MNVRVCACMKMRAWLSLLPGTGTAHTIIEATYQRIRCLFALRSSDERLCVQMHARLEQGHQGAVTALLALSGRWLGGADSADVTQLQTTTETHTGAVLSVPLSL